MLDRASPRSNIHILYYHEYFLSHYSCYTSCYEIVPTLDPKTLNATDEEVRIGIDHFAEETRRRLQFGRCDNDVLIVYVEQYQYVS